MRFYVSGPMRGYELFNFPAFDAARDALLALGHEVISPADHDRDEGLDPANPDLESQGFDLSKALAWDFGAILQCDAIALLDGWRRSSGARAEAFVAANVGAKFYRSQGDRVWEIPTPALKVVPA